MWLGTATTSKACGEDSKLWSMPKDSRTREDAATCVEKGSNCFDTPPCVRLYGGSPPPDGGQGSKSQDPRYVGTWLSRCLEPDGYSINQTDSLHVLPVASFLGTHSAQDLIRYPDHRLL